MNHNIKLLYALNEAAAELQRSAHSEAEVFRAFSDQLAGLGLCGGITLLNEEKTDLSVRALSCPAQILSHHDQLASLNTLETRQFPVDDIQIYDHVIRAGEAMFLSGADQVLFHLFPSLSGNSPDQASETYKDIPGIFAPLIMDKTVQGILNVFGHDLSVTEVPIIIAFANHISIALENARLFDTTRQAETTHQQLITAIKQSAESVVITNDDGRILYVNPAFETITGYSRAEALGHKMNLVKSGKQDNAFYEKMWRTIKAGKVWQGRIINKNKDGSLHTDDVTISPIRNEHGEIANFVAVQHDITRELQLEEQYHHAQRMEAVGRLAAGIAHDFNNLLTAINGFAELMKRQLPPEDPLQSSVETILSAGWSAIELVRQLLVFSRKQVVEPKVIDLNTIILALNKMLRRTIGEDIALQTNLVEPSWPVKVDPAQIEQVIVNLVVNARDAMPKGGTLTIATENVFVDEVFAQKYLGLETGEYLLLSVTDTGIGMTKEIKAHIYEPFFTTKEKSNGTGLGLSTVFGIVNQAGGYIRVDSEPGQGATFSIYLPKVTAPVEVSRASYQLETLPKGKETILVAEDEVSLRKLTVSILRNQGYTVLEAADGQEALQLGQQYDRQIDLLLVDVVMPQINGKTLSGKLEAIRPKMKVLYTSGYTDNIIAQHGILEPGTMLLKKPFSPGALTQKVREALDQ